MDKIERDMLSIAAEFAVASELGRRNIYAQPTFGHLKKTDLLIMGKGGKVLRIEVKGKQEKQWPNCKGIPDDNSVMVLVDFAGKTDRDRPDFYVLTLDDWRAFVKSLMRKHPDKRIEIDSENVPVWKTQVKGGKPYKGTGINVTDVDQHKEKWEKIARLLE
jgi:hypothetical protein